MGVMKGATRDLDHGSSEAARSCIVLHYSDDGSDNSSSKSVIEVLIPRQPL